MTCFEACFFIQSIFIWNSADCKLSFDVDIHDFPFQSLLAGHPPFRLEVQKRKKKARFQILREVDGNLKVLKLMVGDSFDEF